MSNPGIDIIVPIWNRPVETRECLVSLVEHTPDARLILLNNGSDRETEGLLEEFAESLDDRALLLSTIVNLGFVKAVNRGLARAEADFAAVVRSTSKVTEGWLDPLLELAAARGEAGILVPRLVEGPAKRGLHGTACPATAYETSCGDFAAMVVRREVFEKIGAFDEEMDGGPWCLKDYSRRALREGYLTYTVEGAPVSFEKDIPLGSLARREENLGRSIAVYNVRWGEEKAFCVYFPKGSDTSEVRRCLDVMLTGARQGQSFTVLVSPGTLSDLASTGCGCSHTNIRLEKFSRLFSLGDVARRVASLRSTTPGLVRVSGTEGAPFPGDDGSIPFSELERMITGTQVEKYGQEKKLVQLPGGRQYPLHADQD